MYPHERSLVEKLSDKPFVIIGINSDDNPEAIKSSLEKENITWRSFWNGKDGTEGPISKQWNVSGWPTLHVLDAEGKIRYKHISADEVDGAIETLLAEMGHEDALSEPLTLEPDED